MNTEIWYFPVSALINAVTSTFLGFYLVFTSLKKRVARYLLYFCFAVAAWSYGYFMWQMADNATDALFWVRILMIGAIFTSISYFHLVLVFINIDKERFYRILLIIFYFFSFLWLFLDFTPYFVVGVETLSYFNYWPIAGPFYTPYLIAFFTHVIYASILLLKYYRKIHGIVKIQTVLLLLGLSMAFVGGSTNYPLWYGIDIAPWGNSLVSIYVILTVYAMMKYKFMDMKVIMAELFAGLVSIIFLVEIFFSRSISESILRVLALTFVILFSMMLVRSVRREIRGKEEITDLAHSLEKANLKLKELDRQKTDFLSIAAHQLRTPLSIMKGYIELIEDGAFGKPTKGIVKTLDEMDESNERLVKLVDEFLDITRIEQGRTKFDFAAHDMNKMITNTIKELQEKADIKGQKILWKLNPAIKNVYMDDDKIRHVIFNFIDNSTKYSGESKKIWVSLEKEKDHVVVKVKDEGIGFDKQDEVNFFQKFYRGNNVKGTNVNGTGLGLYVCRRFIEAHQGEVWGKSEGLGQGSEFGFWLPVKRA